MAVTVSHGDTVDLSPVLPIAFLNAVLPYTLAKVYSGGPPIIGPYFANETLQATVTYKQHRTCNILQFSRAKLVSCYGKNYGNKCPCPLKLLPCAITL